MKRIYKVSVIAKGDELSQRVTRRRVSVFCCSRKKSVQFFQRDGQIVHIAGESRQQKGGDVLGQGETLARRPVDERLLLVLIGQWSYPKRQPLEQPGS